MIKRTVLCPIDDGMVEVRLNRSEILSKEILDLGYLFLAANSSDKSAEGTLPNIEAVIDRD
jgi:hypothetical protein